MSKVRFLPIVLLLVFALSFLVHRYFEPHWIGPGEFPYLQNTFSRYGFYTMNLYGTAYQYRGIYDIFSNWQKISTLVLFLFLGFLPLYIKKLRSPFFFFTAGYLCLMLLVGEMFDRYLIPIYPAFILLFLELTGEFRKIYTMLIAPFVLFLAFLGYQYSMDFVLTNNYLYTKSREILYAENLNPEEVSVNRAWKHVYPGETPRKYYFSYDRPEVNEDISRGFELVETKIIDYPLNTHLDPYIYLYRNTTYESSGIKKAGE